jgi:hypothetical protein
MVKIDSGHQARVRPVAITCTTLDIGISGYVECLRGGPNSCRFALPFGYAFLCSEPRLVAETVRPAPRALPAGTRRPGQ